MHFICRVACFKPLVLSLIFSGVMMNAQAAPIGGQVTAGTGNISQSGNTTTIHQQSQNLSLNWNQFDIAPKETVNFTQPNSHALAVNRVLGSNQASQIQGNLNANGQVWLINPNGVVFGKNSIVNVGGLLASTLDIADSELNKSQRQFSGSGTGSIINKGTIQTIKGGYVAMIANTVSNQGHINTPQGTTALAGGSQVTVTFAENQLTGIRVDKSTLNNLVENKQVIQAPGGSVIMTAGAHDSLLSSAVNNSGIVEAQTLKNHNGSIILLGGMAAGTTKVSGTLDASAPHGGKGGRIETSAAHVKINLEAKITTQSNEGTAGTWTIDPQDYTIAASGGDITGAQVSSLLASNNIIISSDQGQTAGTGNLNVNNAISWSNANSLTLNAVRNVNFNNGGTVSNTGGGALNARADSGATGTGTIVMAGGSINVSGAGGTINFYYNPTTFGTPSTFSNVIAGAGTTFTGYMLINTPSNFAAIASNPTQNYAVGTNLNLDSIANFSPINFSGKLDGQNNTLSNLTITGNNSNVGLFSTINAGAVVKNMILRDVNVSGVTTVGALAGTNNGTISHIIASGTVSATGSIVGGVIGVANAGSTGNYITSRVDVSAMGINTASSYVGGFAGDIGGGTYDHIAVTGDVTTGDHNRIVGGFAGHNNGTIKNASYTGSMTTPYDGYTGGFIGYTDAASVVQGAYTTADINAGDYGYDSNAGFIGVNYGTIDSSYSAGDVTLGQSWNSGAFVGYNVNNISNSYATGNFTVTPGPVSGGNGTQTFIQNYGGLVGLNVDGALSNDYATGNVNATGSSANPAYRVGGLVGFLAAGSVSHSYASGDVIVVGADNSFGGLIGHTAASVTNVYASGKVSATGGGTPSNIGGLIGYICGTGSLRDGYSVGNVSASAKATNVGGLVGLMGGAITGRSFWDTTTSGQASSAGGTNVVGMSTAEMQTQANFTSATAANGNVNPNWNFNNIWEIRTKGPLHTTPVFNPPNVPVITPGPTPLPTSTAYYPLTLSKVSANNKVYDSTSVATVSGTLSGVLPGDSVAVSSLNGMFNDKNVGIAKPVTITQPTLSGESAGKYVLVPASLNNATAHITPRLIDVTVAGVDKVYDGTITGNVTCSSSDILPGDSINFSAIAHFAGKNVGENKPVSVDPIHISGIDSDNYTVCNCKASTTANITPRGIDITATGMDKVYDGTPAARVRLDGSNVIAGDDVGFTHIVAQFSDKNVGTNKPVTLKDIRIAGTGSANYVVNNPDVSTVASITPLSIGVTATGVDKVYDGTLAAQVKLAGTNVIAGDDVGFIPTVAQFSDKNVGANKPVTLKDVRISGADSGNYVVDIPAMDTLASITPRGIDVTAVGMDKVYDGTSAAQVKLAGTNVIAGDDVAFTHIVAQFSDKKVGADKPITLNDLRVGGADSVNYVLNNPRVNTVASITPRGIDVVASGVDKVYDGTPVAHVKLAGNNVIAGDDVGFTNIVAQFSDKNVGTEKSVTFNDLRIGGSDSSNYVINNPDVSTVAGITPLSIDVTAMGVDKVYDGTPAAQVTFTSNGVVPSDNVNFIANTASFADKNTGTNKPVSISDIRADGIDGSNYIVNNPNLSTTASIIPLNINVTTIGVDKVYDGTLTDAINYSSPDILPGDSINFSGIATFADKNVGVEKPVTIKDISTGGIDGSNYIVNNPSTSTTAGIMPLNIANVTATGVDKVYDGTPAAQVKLVGSNVIAGDDVSFIPTVAQFSDKNVGANKPIAIKDIHVSGTDSGNYATDIPDMSTTASIALRSIDVTATGMDKIYDGTPAAQVKLVGSNVIAGDDVGLSNIVAQFVDKNVGTDKVVKIKDIHVSGADSGNYAIDIPAMSTTTASVAPRGIDVTVAGVDKVYDGTPAAQVKLAGSNVIAGDDVGFADTVAQFSDKNVGQDKPITIKAMGIGGIDAANYVVNNPDVSTVASIMPRDIDVTAKGVDKIYDGTRTGAVIYNSSDILPADKVNFSGIANFGDKNVGLDKPVMISDIRAGGADSGNYVVNNRNASTTASITPRGIDVTATGADKTYDGTMTGVINYSSSDILPGDSVDFSGIATFVDKNVGIDRPVTIKDISTGGIDGSNYIVNNPSASTIASITPLNIAGTVTATGVDKVYDGTHAAQVKLESSHVIPGDDVSFINGVASFADKNVGQDKPITIKDIHVSGADNGNYVVDVPDLSTTASITPRGIDVTATGVDKGYDGTVAAQVKLAGSNVIAGDDVDFTNIVAQFVDKNVGQDKPITLKDVRIAGTDSGNYVVNNPDVSTVAGITPRGIDVTAMGIDKVYDGTITGDVTYNSANILPGDSVDFGGIVNFAGKNVGINKPVSVSDIHISGIDGNNYSVNNLHTRTTANITPRGIDVTAVGIDKVYDGTPAAQVKLAGTNVIAGDDVGFSHIVAQFSDKHVGIDKAITFNDLRVSGADSGNYVVNNPSATTASITPLNIANVTATGVDKVYDGTPSAQVKLASSNVIAGDDVDFIPTVAQFLDKHVGTNKPVTLKDIRVSGVDSGNYTVAVPDMSTVASIMPRGIDVAASGVDKVYDGTPAAQVKLAGTNVIAGDEVGFIPTVAQFSDKSVGTDKPIMLKDIRIGGADSRNYVINNPGVSTVASIMPRGIDVAASGVDKVYDGTPTAQVKLAGSNVIAGDDVGFTNIVAQFSDKNVGTEKPVTLKDVRIGGTDSSNYIINNPDVSTVAGIKPLSIDVTAIGVDKVYDGTPAAQVTFTSNGVVPNDKVNFIADTVSFADKNTGTNKSVSVRDIHTSGIDGSNYSVNNPNLNTMATIMPLNINVIATGVDKVYDGTTTAQVILTTIGALPSDNIQLSGIANFLDSDIGTNKLVDVSDIHVSGTGSDNYMVNNCKLRTTASITASN